jgi:hypothetical protein
MLPVIEQFQHGIVDFLLRLITSRRSSARPTGEFSTSLVAIYVGHASIHVAQCTHISKAILIFLFCPYPPSVSPIAVSVGRDLKIHLSVS